MDMSATDTKTPDVTVRTPDLTIHMTDRQLHAAAKGINLAALRQSLHELEALCHHKIAAADTFTEACKKTAGKAGLEPSVVSAYVNSIVRDSRQKNREKAEQLALLFEEITD